MWVDNTPYRWEMKTAWRAVQSSASLRIEVPFRDEWAGNLEAGLNVSSD
jgi:hypothetical protein